MSANAAELFSTQIKKDNYAVRLVTIEKGGYKLGCFPTKGNSGFYVSLVFYKSQIENGKSVNRAIFESEHVDKDNLMPKNVFVELSDILTMYLNEEFCKTK